VRHLIVAALQVAHGPSANAGSLGKLLLRQASSQTVFAHKQGEGLRLSHAHRASRQFCEFILGLVVAPQGHEECEVW
jgi:hypothetical protein